MCISMAGRPAACRNWCCPVCADDWRDSNMVTVQETPESLAGGGGATTHAAEPLADDHPARVLWLERKGMPPEGKVAQPKAEVDELKGEVADLKATVDELKGEVRRGESERIDDDETAEGIA